MTSRSRHYLNQLLAISSLTGHEKQIADMTEALCAELVGAPNVVRVGHTVMASLIVNPAYETIILAGHLDTVNSVNQFHGQELSGKLYGLGASDMKGGDAVIFALLEHFSTHPPHYNLRCIFYDREEGPYLENGLGPFMEQYGAELQTAQLAICLEPTSNRVQIGCLGTLHALVVFHGVRAHSARPWLGVNAIHRASQLLTALAVCNPVDYRFGELCYREVLSATTAEFSGARNIVPDRFALNLNYRFAPGKSTDQACAELEMFARAHGADEVIFTDVSPSGNVALDNPAIQELISLSQAAAEAKQAWTDVARFAALGIDAINFGPGQPEMAHKENEYIELDALERNYAVMVRFLAGG